MEHEKKQDGMSNRLIIYLVIAFIVLFAILYFLIYSSGLQGDPKDSLLDFTCEELKKGTISTDGPDGRFVVDVASMGWVSETLLMQAMEEKGCISKEAGYFNFLRS